MKAAGQSLVVSSSSSNQNAAGDMYLIDFKREMEVRTQFMHDAKNQTIARLNTYQPHNTLEDIQTDRLEDRYIIHTQQPLPELSYGQVIAYAASDDINKQQALYALVCHPAHPYRDEIYKHIKTEHPHMLRYFADGTVYISSLNDQRHVFIFERPKGKRLSEILERHQTLALDVVLQQIIKPINSVLEFFVEQGISHCRIHPSNIFIGDRTIVGECIGEPAGFSQEYLYEPPERIDALPEGKGKGSIRTDAYALGVLAIELLSNIDQFRKIGKDNFVNNLMKTGSFPLFMNNRYLPENIVDFARGTLSDVLSDRWTPAHITNWLGGKRYNAIQSTVLHEASRPFEFDGQEYHSGRALAHAFFQKWNTARSAVRNPMLSRWVEQNMHKKDLAQRLRSAVVATGGEQSTSSKQNNELLARTILLLDPFGPIRFNNLAFHIDGIGSLLCDAMHNNRQQDIQHMLECFNINLPNFASEVQNNAGGEDRFDALFKIDKIRHRVYNSALGFGIERCVYDLNPSLPCFSPKLKEYHVANNTQLLYILDKIAVEEATHESLLDTHIAAFAASQSSLIKEVSFTEFQRFPHIGENKELIAITILAKAQEKARIRQLYGLSHWVAYRLMEYIPTLHSQRIRETICNAMLNAAHLGNISAVITAFANKGLLEKDLIGFKQSSQLFHNNFFRIQKLHSYDFKRKQASDLGSSIAMIISMFILVLSFYFTLTKNLHL